MDNIKFENLESPIFIFGNPRSGTTLLRLMVNAHPEIVVAPECGFAQWLHEDFKGWKEKNVEDEIILQDFIDKLFASRKFDTWGLDEKMVAENVISLRPKNYAQLVSSIYFTYAKSKSNSFTRWGDKNNYYIDHIELIFELFPNAKAILIVRDGRDVACSYRELAKRKIDSRYSPNLPVSMKEIAAEWRKNNKKALDDLKKFAPSGFHTIRYEDMVTESEEAMVALCNSIGLEYSTEMLDYHKDVKRNEPEEFLQWKEKTLKRPMTTQVGRYNQDLTKEEIDDFENIAHDLLTSFNYI